jgi:predicted RNA-binding Zn-ribbon protein involved in translation (DUF1610 family)
MSVVAYQCPNHGRISRCNVAEDGARVCPACGEPVAAITGDPEGDR